MKIAILPIGQVEQNVLRHVRENVVKVFPRTNCFILENPLVLPKEAYNIQRKQYHSSFLLDVIREHSKKTDADKVLGITVADLYVPQLNFVFGEAELPGRVAIISLCRLVPEFYGDSANQALFMERVVKEAVHELGHTFGLHHCLKPSCVMFFSNSIRDVDSKGQNFCPTCTERISRLTR